MKRRHTTRALVGIFALMLTACGNSDGSSGIATTPATAAPGGDQSDCSRSHDG